MGNWESIYKRKGKVFLKFQEDMPSLIKLMKKEKVRRVLDLGCGYGRHVVLFAKAGFDVYGTDTSKNGLELTRQWLNKLNLKAKLKQASCFKKFPFKDNFFDAIVSVQVIHHAKIKSIRYCISEIGRILKPKGIVFVSVTKSSYRKRATRFKVIEPRTYVMMDGEEKGLPHYIYNQKLLRKDFKHFRVIDIHVDSRGHNCIIGRLKQKY